MLKPNFPPCPICRVPDALFLVVAPEILKALETFKGETMVRPWCKFCRTARIDILIDRGIAYNTRGDSTVLYPNQSDRKCAAAREER